LWFIESEGSFVLVFVIVLVLSEAVLSETVLVVVIEFGIDYDYEHVTGPPRPLR
jgi:hypothetical protein